MSSRLPATPTIWLLGLAGAATLAIAIYQARASSLDEAKANRQVAHARQAIQQLRAEHAELREQLRKIQESARSIAIQAEAALQQRQHPTTPRIAQPRPRLAAASQPVAMPVMAGSELGKEQAWKSFFRPLKGCDVWRDDRHMVECQNYAIRAKREFEQRWSDGALSTPGG